VNNDHTKIGIVIPFYNGDTFIDACVNSIEANNYLNSTIYVINNSDRETKIESIAAMYSNVKVINTESHIGFGKANNIGAELAIGAGAEIIISVNQDAILDRNCIAELLAPFQENPDIAITSPLLFNYDFSRIEELVMKYLSQCPDLFYDALNRQIKMYYPVKLLIGACFAIRSDTIRRYGFFDSLYFMYGEDDDLCRRMEYVKKLVVIAPKAKVAHRHSNTSSEADERKRIHRLIRNAEVIYMLKDLNYSAFINLIRVFIYRTYHYMRCLVKLDVKEFALYFISDLKVLPKLKKILKRRSLEKKMKYEHA
jgi:GT2 family glycosyltransferase